jgi:hypothetical protein
MLGDGFEVVDPDRCTIDRAYPTDAWNGIVSDQHTCPQGSHD